MSPAASLLPPSATPLESAAVRAASALGELPTYRLWNPHTCPAAALPALAWALSVEQWDDDWPEHVKRDICAASLPIHARKGTRASVRAALGAAGIVNEALGYTAHIVEGFSAMRRDASVLRDGTRTRGEEDAWASYSVILNRPITIAQAETARRLLDSTAPARCTLAELTFTATAWLRDGASRRNATITYGAA